MYADYQFYTETYKGTVSADEYNRLVVRAEAEINRMTFGRAAKATGDDLNAVKYAECAIVDELSYQGPGGSGDVTSESNDGISRSYATGAVARSSRQRIDIAAWTWLSSTNLCAVPV